MSQSGRKNRDTALLTALASGLSVRAAAEQAGLSARTAHRRLADRDFARQVDDLRAELVKRASGRMADSMAEAADTLRQLLKAESENVRLGACRATLELGVKLRESVEMEQRLRTLEERLARTGSFR